MGNFFWLASYPKSGNTWVRALLCAYFYSKSGNFNFNLLNNNQSSSMRLNVGFEVLLLSAKSSNIFFCLEDSI